MASDADVRPFPTRPEAPADPATDPDARAELTAWRDAYRSRLAAPDGWWAVTNLAWLDGDAGWLGTTPDAELPLRAPAPARVARLERDGNDGERLWLTPSGAVPLKLDGEELDAPASIGPEGSRLTLEQDPAVQVAVFLRAGRWGVRVYDPAQAARRASEDATAAPDATDGMAGVAWFEPTPGWRVRATVEPGGDETLPIVDLLGAVRETPVAARLRFELDGAEHVLLATAQGDRLFVNFRDASNGASTYGAGRFLVADAPVDGTTILDFHRAHHPPCAHTPYAMCPLPPLANRLASPVTAGERLPRPRAET